MKKLLFAVLAVMMASMATGVSGQSFDLKLKRFVTITDKKYVPEVSCEEAVKLGFTVNDYKRFVQYVDSLNVHTERSLTRPENLFLCSFLEYRDDKVVLNISLEKALRAGATVEGYYQTMEILNSELLPYLPEEEVQKGIAFQKKIHKELQEFARKNPDSSAVVKFFTPPPMEF